MNNNNINLTITFQFIRTPHRFYLKKSSKSLFRVEGEGLAVTKAKERVRVIREGDDSPSEEINREEGRSNEEGW